MIINNVELAKILLKYFTTDQSKIMLAIAYAESSLNTDAEGDSPNTLNALGHTSSASVAKYWNCPVSGKTDDNSAGASIGLFQIFLGANHDVVMNLSGISFATKSIGLSFPVPVNEADACKLVTWLKNPTNNVRAAKSIFDSQGYGAWSTYNNGAYLKYTNTSVDAVNSAQTPTTTPPPQPSPIPGTSYTVGTSIVIFGIAAAMFGVSYYLIKRGRGEI